MKIRRAVLLLAAIMVYAGAHAQNNTDLRLNTIVIDPGHGGKDPGAISQDKRTREKDLTLSISKKLAAKIRERYPEMKVILTRDKDVFVALDDRARIATKNNANLFISVHINAATNRSANGFSAYILGQSSNKNSDTYAFNMEVVKRENSVIYLEDNYAKYGNLDDDSPESQILSQFMYNAFREQSLAFSEIVNNGMTAPFKKSSGVHQANFAVLRLASMPAALLELGFISNASDLTLLRSEKEIDRMVDNLFKSFCEYKSSYDASMGFPEVPAPKVEAKPEPKPAPKPTPKPEPKPAPEIEPVQEPEPAPVVQTAEPAKAKEPEPELDQRAVFRPIPPALPKESSEVQVSPTEAMTPSVQYGIQVLASGKEMKDSDPFFMGYDVVRIKAGSLIKYIIKVSDDIEKTREEYKTLKEKFKDSFIVKIEDGKASLTR